MMVKNKINALLFMALISSCSLYGMDVPSKKIAIIVSVVDPHITTKLLEGAGNFLRSKNVIERNILIAYVPGLHEIPFAVKMLAETKRFDAIICMGAVDYSNKIKSVGIADYVLRGISQVSMDYKVPVIPGIVVFEDLDEAMRSSEPIEGSIGWEAARAALAMTDLVLQIQQLKI